MKEYKELVTKQNELIDVYADDPEICAEPGGRQSEALVGIEVVDI